MECAIAERQVACLATLLVPLRIAVAQVLAREVRRLTGRQGKG